jgi:hypothetical protein
LPFAALRNPRTGRYLIEDYMLSYVATESLLHGLGGRVGLLHVAAPAVYEPADPLLSHLALAPGEGQDGNLAAHEVLAGLDLSGGGLVVLSACGTAADERGGTATASLARAFFYAVSAGVLSPAWDAGGDASAAFLDEFYRHSSAVPPPRRLYGRPSSRCSAIRATALPELGRPSA